MKAALCISPVWWRKTLVILLLCLHKASLKSGQQHNLLDEFPVQLLLSKWLAYWRSGAATIFGHTHSPIGGSCVVCDSLSLLQPLCCCHCTMQICCCYQPAIFQLSSGADEFSSRAKCKNYFMIYQFMATSTKFFNMQSAKWKSYFEKHKILLLALQWRHTWLWCVDDYTDLWAPHCFRTSLPLNALYPVAG